MMGEKSIIFVILVMTTCVFINEISAGFTTTQIGPQPIWNSTHTDKLRQDLLLNYDKFARPAQHYNQTVVNFSLTIKHIELIEYKSTLTLHSWLRLSWTDEKLKWIPANYGGLTTLNLADHEIWQPDILLYNSATPSSLNHYGNTHCVVYEDGQVLWVPPAVFNVLCNINLKYWPFDTQKCQLIMGSWTYNGEQIDIKSTSDKADMDLVVTNSDWDILSTSVTRNSKFYDCCTEPYVDVTITVELSRVSHSYKALIISPAFVIIILILLNFWLPPDAGEKIMLNGCTAIIICMFLLYFTQRLPAMGSHTPLIVLFYSSCLYVVGFSMIISVIVIWLYKTEHTRSLPWIIKKPLTGAFGKLLFLDAYTRQSTSSSSSLLHHHHQFATRGGHHGDHGGDHDDDEASRAEEMRDHQVTSDELNHSGDEHRIIRSTSTTSFAKKPLQNDWILLAAAIDRISFCFFCLLISILSITYSV